MITINRKHNDAVAFWDVSVHLSSFLGFFLSYFLGFIANCTIKFSVAAMDAAHCSARPTTRGKLVAITTCQLGGNFEVPMFNRSFNQWIFFCINEFLFGRQQQGVIDDEETMYSTLCSVPRTSVLGNLLVDAECLIKCNNGKVT